MIKLDDCSKCKNRMGFDKGHTICKAFPMGVPYEHQEKDLISIKKCNNGIGFEPIEDNDKPSE